MIIYIYICYAKTFIIVREIWGAISICVIACFKQITRLWNSRYANCSTWNETNGVHQDLYTNSDFMLTVRSGTRPDLPDFAVLGILVWAMTSQGHRTIRKWCSPAITGIPSHVRCSWPRRMEAVGALGEGVILRVPGNLSEYCLLLITSDFVERPTWRIFNWNYIWSISSS